MNEYLKNADKIEFVVTLACTGRCIHCQNGDPPACSPHLDPAVAAEAVYGICGEYGIRTVMTFGGEPLLYPRTVAAIHRAATECGVGKRQLITNGYFTRDKEKIAQTVAELSLCGVNDILLSVDAFHQADVPEEYAAEFALRVLDAGIPLRLNPAWLVSRDDANAYNEETRRIVGRFKALGVREVTGDVIFPAGRALEYLSSYFDENTKGSPYEDDPYDVRTVSVGADGETLGGNIYENGILDILRSYRPD